MKILVISRGIPTERYPQWGCFERDQAEALVNNGNSVAVLSVDARFRLRKGSYGLHKKEINGVIYYNYVSCPQAIVSRLIGKNRYSRLKTKKYDAGISQIIKDLGKPDIIYSHFFNNTSAVIPLKGKYNIPIASIEHLGRFINPDWDLAVKSRNEARIAFSGCDQLISVSEKLRDCIKSTFGIDSEVCGNVVGKEFAEFDIKGRKKRENGRFRFVSCGSLNRNKGFDLLIKAAAKLSLPKDVWELLIIGSGPSEKELKNLISQYGLNDNVILTGQMSKKEIVRTFAEADCFVLSSHSETFGVVVIEAMATGLPIVLTECGGTKGIVDDNSGIYVPVNNIEKLNDAMEHMYHNANNYDPAVVRKQCMDAYSPEAIANKLEQIFCKTIKKNSK